MKKWNVKCEDFMSNNSSYNSMDCSRENNLLFSILKTRGIEESEFNSFLNPKSAQLSSPYIFSDMEKAKERIFQAIKNNELILIWGDFDCDGVTSTAILYKTLKALNANFDYIIPDREKMGHGINTKFILPYIAKNKPRVLITVDCGISNVKEIDLIKNFNIDVILTDHHKAPDVLPDAFAIINPKAKNSLKDDLNISEIKAVDELAGAGVAYKLASALLEDIDNDILKEEILILACTGTIADVVPLLYENRTITALGLDLINKGIHKGIKQLFDLNCKNKSITSYDVAFILAPRINAAGRLGTAEPAFKLLTEDNEAILKTNIKELENYNRIRQNLCDEIFNQANDEIARNQKFKKEKAIILFNENWHVGVIGIVASKLVEKFYKPVFIVTKDDENIARCSIRGIKEYNITEILDENSEYFTGYGGHSLAGGFSFDLNIYSFDTVKNAILSSFNLKEDIKIQGPMVDIDLCIESEDINEGLINIIEKLEPTGQNNPKPIFAIKDVELISKKTMGKENNHLSFKIKKDNENFNCIWWKHNEIPIIEKEKFDLAFEPKINNFNNETSIRLYTVDLKQNNIPQEFTSKFYDHRMKSDILPQINEYVKRKNVDISIRAKKIKTKTLLREYDEILKRIPQDNSFNTEDIMFFDYPASFDDFNDILNNGYSKIHLLKEDFDFNIESHIKQIIGMLKYATSAKNGKISVKNFADMTGLTENFIQIMLDILDEINSIKILDIDKIEFITPPHLESFYKNHSYEDLEEEFKEICEFKKYIAQKSLDDIEKLFVKN